MRYKLTISYDGTPFCGWQVQKNGTSIQAYIQKALEKTLRHPTNLTGSGRTDAGVHAKGQVAHFDTDQTLSLEHYPLTLNSLLPPEIRIKKIEQVAPDFHSRYSAKRKIYHYYLSLGSIMSPFNKLYCHHFRGKFDLSKVKKGAEYFIGTHDFTSFANMKPDAPTDSVRTIYRLDLVPTKEGVCLQFEGNGFLYKMVRNITGTLLDVGRGKISAEEIQNMLLKKNRVYASACAPPQGLFLERVIYPPFTEDLF